MTTRPRPAFYALAPRGWRDFVTLLHPPYTLWHLSYVAIGAALAPVFRGDRLLATIAAFFLAVGIGAHALDELNGRQLRTEIPSLLLWLLAWGSIAAAVAIGIAGAAAFDLWLLAFVAVGAVLVVVYNLELLGGVLHNDATFALAWGAFPLLTGYFASAGRLTPEVGLAAAFAACLSLAQRRLSTPARTLRRRVTRVSGTLDLSDGRTAPITSETFLGPTEGALRALTAAIVSLAAALVVLRLA
ncbi:MAG: hypothetical protein ABR521_10125 [Gaiellaceae bacterium]